MIARDQAMTRVSREQWGFVDPKCTSYGAFQSLMAQVL